MSDARGYCVHGTYVGGCGIDWMCGDCEEGQDTLIRNRRPTLRVRTNGRHSALGVPSIGGEVAIWTRYGLEVVSAKRAPRDEWGTSRFTVTLSHESGAEMRLVFTLSRDTHWVTPEEAEEAVTSGYAEVLPIN